MKESNIIKDTLHVPRKKMYEGKIKPFFQKKMPPKNQSYNMSAEKKSDFWRKGRVTLFCKFYCLWSNDVGRAHCHHFSSFLYLKPFPPGVQSKETKGSNRKLYFSQVNPGKVTTQVSTFLGNNNLNRNGNLLLFLHSWKPCFQIIDI